MHGGAQATHGPTVAPARGSQGASHAQPAGYGFGRTFGSAPGIVTDPGFAERLGKTVGMSGQPGAAFPPGFGNINNPGVQPLPMNPQPLQTGSPFPLPNINHPGGVPGLYGNHPYGQRGRFYEGFGGSPYLGTIYVPYYVPVYTYTGVITTTPSSPPEPPRPAHPFEIQPYTGSQPPATQPQPGQPQTAPSPQGRTVTLLAFKDSTVIAVTDYWLEGYMLVFETSSGSRTFVPLDRLDFALTQQLNFERNVRFVLEARP